MTKHKLFFQNVVKIQKTNVPMGTPFCQENAVRVAQRKKKKRHFFEPFFLSQKSAVAAAKQRKRQKSWGGNNSAGMFMNINDFTYIGVVEKGLV